VEPPPLRPAREYKIPSPKGAHRKIKLSGDWLSAAFYVIFGFCRYIGFKRAIPLIKARTKKILNFDRLALRLGGVSLAALALFYL
jgi:hypothetical protein